MEWNKKFKWSELYTNSTGKTSGSGFLGLWMGLLAMVLFTAGAIGWWCGIEGWIEYLDKVLALVLAATVLLGVRKVAGQINGKNGNNEKP